MEIYKTSEKLIIWMHRSKISGQQIAKKIGITRQAVSNKLRDNSFSKGELSIIHAMGFKD